MYNSFNFNKFEFLENKHNKLCFGLRRTFYYSEVRLYDETRAGSKFYLNFK